MNLKIVFYKVFSLFSKDYFENPISNLHYASKPLWPIYKVLIANLFYHENWFSYCPEMMY
jgi:hypothetical protein